MPPLAQRNLLHDKVRLTVTLTGIVFAVVLIVVELGLFVGFTVTTSSIVDKSKVDLWIVSKGTPYIEQGAAFSERKLYQVLATPGIASADKYIVRFSNWKTPEGAEEGIQIVGFNLYSGVGGPWNVVEGNVEDLKPPDAVMVDEIYRKKLGVTRIGETFEINGRRAHVVGFTRGIRAFTTTPYVFTSFKNAQGYTRIDEDQTFFILVRALPGMDLPALQHQLESRLRDVDVLTHGEIQQHDKDLLDVHHRRGCGSVDRGTAGTRGRGRSSRANHLRDDYGPHPRVRHAEGHGRAQ